MSLGKTFKLNTGAVIPTLGFGTWQSEPGQAGTAVYEALKAGYKHIDLAKVYGNQKEIGEGFKKAFAEIPNLKREELFITSKLWNSQHKPEDVPGALDDCLKELQLEYLDLYLMHFPVAFGETSNPHTDLFPQEGDEIKILDTVSIRDTWAAMTKLDKKKARAVGVSNFTVEYLESIINATGVTPAANQVERHPLLPQPELIEYCKQKNIHVTAYSAFGNNMIGKPLLINDDRIKSIAEKENATPAQVILAWSQIGGHSVIPKSVTASRIQANFQEIELSKEAIAAVDAVGKDPIRYNVPYTANQPRWDVNIFGTSDEAKAGHKIIV